MRTFERERFLKEREARLHNQHIRRIEVEGVNVAKEPPKWKLKRLSSGKELQIIWDDEKEEKENEK